MRYAYPALFRQGNENVTVSFPDLACVTQGADYQQAFKNAREILSLHIYGMLEDEELLPAPSRLEDIPLEKGKALAVIDVDLEGFKPDWELENFEQKR